MNDKEMRRQILERVARGELKLEEANGLLAELDAGGESQVPPVTGEVITRDPAGGEIPHGWKDWWQIPFWISFAFLGLSAYWMVKGYQASGLGWGFWLSFLLFLLSVAGLVLSFLSRNAKWLHVRIVENEGGHRHNINISLPLPLRLGSWAVRQFSWAMPSDIQDGHIDEIINALDQSVSSDQPVHIVVDGDDDEHVEVFIG